MTVGQYLTVVKAASRAPHARRSAVQVDVPPAERERLAAAHTGHGQQEPQRVQLAALGRPAQERGELAGVPPPLRSNGLTGSMGRVGACGDNAAMESFFALPQKNVLDRQRWSDRQQLRLAIITWIERTHRRNDSADSAASRPSNTRQSTRPHMPPEPPSPRVN